MTTRLRLVRIAEGDLDRQLAAIDHVTLTRTAQALHAELTLTFDEATRSLALAGVQVEPDLPVRVPHGYRPAMASHLEPIAVDDAVDVVEIRRVPLSESSATLLRARRLWRRSAADRERCRAILREIEAEIAWRRVVWVRAGQLAGLARRARLSPIVFDRAALQRAPARWMSVRCGAIGRWAFA